jgi:thiamine kinase-like enzyme
MLQRLFIKNKLFSRYFNEFIDHGDFLEKRSMHKVKLKQEYTFLKNVPVEVGRFYPEVHSFVETKEYSSYRIRKIPAVDASHFTLDPNENDLNIKNLLINLSDYFLLVPQMEVTSEEFHQAVRREISQKNLERLDLINALTLAPELNQVCQYYGYRNLIEYVNKLNSSIEAIQKQETTGPLYFSHGDMCFSNILPEGEQLFLIDPKGADTFEKNFRPIHYELAKISQCLYGHYDLINHERFTINETHQLLIEKIYPLPLSKAYFEFLVNQMGTNLALVRLIEASLFISLLPFHQESEKKLRGFLINSLSISSEYL